MKLRSLAAGLTFAALVPTAALAEPVALGLTRAQLEDADLVDASGREIAEVEKVVTDESGAVIGLIVEVDRPDPIRDYRTQIPLDGLEAVPDPRDRGEFNLKTSLTRQDLLALPPAARGKR